MIKEAELEWVTNELQHSVWWPRVQHDFTEIYDSLVKDTRIPDLKFTEDVNTGQMGLQETIGFRFDKSVSWMTPW